MTEDPTHPEAAAAAHADTRFQISWQNHPARIDKLVEWLIYHPADCAILSNSKLDANFGPPSGKNKQEVNTAIARSIFGHEEEYATHPDKYRDSVMSCINQ